MRPALSITSIVLLALIAGCGGTVEGRKGRLRGVASLANEAILSGGVTVRHNPTSCDCPAYELWLNGAWVRIAISGPTPEFPVDRLFLQPAAGGGVTLALTLDSSKPEFCANGTLYFRTSYVPPEPEVEEPLSR